MELIHKIKKVFVAVVLCTAVLVPLQTFAQSNYNCDAYGAGEYQNNQCFTPGTGTTSGNNGRLTDTGRNVLFFGAVGLAGALGGAVLLYFTLKKRKTDKQD